MELHQAKTDEAADAVLRALTKGGVVAIPTDTVFGLAAIPSNMNAVKRIFSLKKRPANINLPFLVSSIEQIKRMQAIITPQIDKLIQSKYIPGPVTVIVGLSEKNTPLPWLEGREEFGFRIPNDKWLLSIIDKVGPIVATSANAHKMSTPKSINEVLKQLDGSPDVAVGTHKINDVASTIINCRLSPPIIERDGLIPQTELLDLLR